MPGLPQPPDKENRNALVGTANISSQTNTVDTFEPCRHAVLTNPSSISAAARSRVRWPHHPTRDLIPGRQRRIWTRRSEEHTSERQSLMRTSYAAFCLKK